MHFVLQYQRIAVCEEGSGKEERTLLFNQPRECDHYNRILLNAPKTEVQGGCSVGAIGLTTFVLSDHKKYPKTEVPKLV